MLLYFLYFFSSKYKRKCFPQDIASWCFSLHRLDAEIIIINIRARQIVNSLSHLAASCLLLLGLRELNKKYEILLIVLFLIFLIFIISEGLLFISFFWTSFHNYFGKKKNMFWFILSSSSRNYISLDNESCHYMLVPQVKEVSQHMSSLVY